jgi:hypothetical protein
MRKTKGNQLGFNVSQFGWQINIALSKLELGKPKNNLQFICASPTC